ncbi:hypothetical protein QN400_21340 [Pseudomonas sp. RTC3]|uniref:hypothetical protein n=1 Tax=Pseudomonas sp. 5C2 TaxID=3048588 RepID=UPI002AB56404|nr:hypothetical protein [Pseudomonas sp. 5C2]MDY7567499.1 hypothetical protein [Pseudomonas sp. 5C2]MEB0064561.1 hypothetical protein [Pseudomonas sp. RTC3]MEB0243031.1 hypothetical protein [Pseudomonas sp. 5C2]
MSATTERRTSIAELQPAFVARRSEASTFERTSFTFGAHRSLPPTHNQSREFGMYRLIDKLHSYRSLYKDWDGYGGEPATYASWSNALEFVSRLAIRFSAPVPMLAGDGEISLFWKKDGRYLEISFPGDNTYHFIFQYSQEQFASDDISLEGNYLDDTLIAYMGRI